MEGVAKLIRTVFVDSLVVRFDIQYESQNPASVEFNLGLKRSYGTFEANVWWSIIVNLGDAATKYSQCGDTVVQHVHNPSAWHWKRA